jgi:hypothetical protein
MKSKKVKCPKTGKMTGQEVPRKWWMYLMPWMKKYYCLDCHHEFVILVGKITISKKFWIPPNDQNK